MITINVVMYSLRQTLTVRYIKGYISTQEMLIVHITSSLVSMQNKVPTLCHLSGINIS